METDVLVLLRQFHSTGKPIQFDEASQTLVFDRLRVPASTPTRFMSKRGAPYTADSVWFLLQNSNKPTLNTPISCKIQLNLGKQRQRSRYMEACSAKQITPVSFVDKKNLLDFLNGLKEADQIREISATVPAGTASISGTAPADGDSMQIDAFEPVELSEEAKAAKASLAQKLQRFGTGSSASAGASDSTLDAGEDMDIVADDKLANLSAGGISKAKLQEMKDRFKKKKVDTEGPTSSSALAKATMDAVGKILLRERALTDRKTVLQAPKQKTFTKLLDIFKEQKKEIKPAEKRQNYDRFAYNEDQVWKQRGVGILDDDFQIDTRGSFAAGAQPQSQESKKRTREEMTPNTKPENSTAPNPAKKPKITAAKGSLNPIIIVPALPHDKSIISIYNAQEFIQNGVYFDSEEKRKSMARPRKLEFKRVRPGSEPVQFTIMHSPVGMSDSDWDRVAAVFVMGEDYQFTGWPTPEPAVLFSKMRGFFLTFDDEKIPPKVASWNVKVLSINRVKRHLDKSANEEFWKFLEEFCAVFRPEIKL